MPYWAKPPLPREQLVLFSQRLDDAVPPEHPVRLLNEILSRLNWSQWEARYHGRRGQPPIHPRVLASVLLYGLLTRVRSSRSLEEAMSMRVDFQWLAEQQTADHTTLSEFRRKFAAELKDLFVQLGVVAKELGLTRLQRLAFDGTRIKANNRRSGSRTPGELKAMRDELAQRFAELEAQAASEDEQEKELFGDSGVPHRLPEQLAHLERRREKVEAILTKLQELEEVGKAVPKRVPITDADARITPNKEGGFAPNYTPLVAVDVESGLIVSAEVIAETCEEQHLVTSLEEVQQQFDLPQPPAEVLADGLFATGQNLEALEENGVTLYSPLRIAEAADNPALREDPTKPVPPEDWQRLPTTTVRTRSGKKQKQLTKSAFVYDAKRNVYWCPHGQALSFEKFTSEKRRGVPVRVGRYRADPQVCAACPLKALCLQKGSSRRTLRRDQYEPLREKLAARMARPLAQSIYAQRRHAVETPFGVIKQQFGARQFLLRGIDQVRTEWRWLATAFNLRRLMSYWQQRCAPSAAAIPPTPG